MLNWAAADNTLVQICGKAATDVAAIAAACAEKGVVGNLSFADINLNADMIVLATPEMAGMPYVVSGLVAAGGLAAALSTADGLLLAIANALSHDIYYKMIDQNAPTSRRLIVSRVLLVIVAILAAYTASTKPSDILSMVSWAFSLAAGGLFPALVLGVWWKRANAAGAVAGMIAGFGITLFYLVMTQYGADLDKATPNMELWWGVKNISSATFGLPLGFAVMIIVSLLTKAPSVEMQNMIEEIRVPRGKQVMEEKTA
jgi:cation/acetate symporter